MGAVSSYSLNVGPLPPISQTTCHVSATVGAAPSPALIVIVTAIIVMVIGASPVTDARALRPGGLSDTQRQNCNTDPCWMLFRTSEDYHQVHDCEDITHPEEDPDKWQGCCVTQRTFYLCLKAIYRNKSLDCHADLGYRSAYYGIERRMQIMNCSQEGATFDPSMVAAGHNQVCTYDGPPVRKFCSLFGDPHLRTFSDQFETCKIQGAWPLLDNRYLTVQVTSKAVNNLYGSATAITELTVMVKRHDDCAAERFVTYQAQGAFLPPMFDDGSVHFGPDRSIELREVIPDRHVEIYLRYINTHIVVRRYPNTDSPFLTVSLLMPEYILNQSVSYMPDTAGSVRTLELCSQGCPDNQRIPYGEYLSRGVGTQQIGGSTQRLFADRNSVDGLLVLMDRDEALRRCRLLDLVDFYLDSCVFDLMNTGDMNFSEAAADALADTIRYHPDHGAVLQNRTTLELSDPPHEATVTSSALTLHNLHNIHRTTFVLLAAILLCALDVNT